MTAKPIRAATYVRVSTTSQETDGTSLGTQEAACRRYAEEHGLAVDESAVYREIHTGGQIWERPELTRLREGIIRDLYAWVAEGAVGMREACRRLNDAGSPPPSMGKITYRDDHRPAWQPGQLAHLIRNPVYKGEGYALRYTANHTTAGAPKL